MGKQTSTQSSIDIEVIAQGNVLIIEQQVSMCSSFSSKDIKDAIWFIPNHKSPKPYGYSSGFFKFTWDRTGPLVCSIVQHFFKTATVTPPTPEAGSATLS